MVIVDTKTNETHSRVSKSEAARIVGVNRSTIKFWEEKRIADNTFKETYNHFIIYFKEQIKTQPKGKHLAKSEG